MIKYFAKLTQLINHKIVLLILSQLKKACVFCRACVCAWTSSLTQSWGIDPSSSANSCCCTPWRKTFPRWAGSFLSTASRHYLWRPSYTWTATRNSLSLQVCYVFALIQILNLAYIMLNIFAIQKHPILLKIFFFTAITAVRTNVANLSDAAMWKIRRARFARNRQKSVRSLRDSVKGGPAESKRAFSLPESLSNRIRE